MADPTPSSDRSVFLREDDDPTLSLAMIVKDEADTIERCLRSAKAHVDEVVIVDTGSTDGTRAIAKKYADVYDEIEWPNSFSEARNHSYSLASGDYIMYLDGDEYIPNPIHWELIRKTIAQPKVALVKLRLHNVLPEDAMLSASVLWHERITYNTPEIRWEGRVHNQIISSVTSFLRRNEDWRAVRAGARIIHTGYALEAEEKQNKYRERLPLLESEYEDPISAITRAYYGFQLSLVYIVLDQYEKAYRVLSDLDYELMNDKNAFYAHYLASRAAQHQGEIEEALHHCEAMLRITRDEPVAYFSLGYLLLRKGDPYEGILTMIEAYRVNERIGEDARFQMNREYLIERLTELFEGSEFSDTAYAVLKAYLEQESEETGVRELLDVFDRSVVESA